MLHRFMERCLFSNSDIWGFFDCNECAKFNSLCHTVLDMYQMRLAVVVNVTKNCNITLISV